MRFAIRTATCRPGHATSPLDSSAESNLLLLQVPTACSFSARAHRVRGTCRYPIPQPVHVRTSSAAGVVSGHGLPALRSRDVGVAWRAISASRGAAAGEARGASVYWREWMSVSRTASSRVSDSVIGGARASAALAVARVLAPAPAPVVLFARAPALAPALLAVVAPCPPSPPVPEQHREIACEARIPRTRPVGLGGAPSASRSRYGSRESGHVF